MKQLGMRLRALREGIGLSQSKFADVIGSTQSSINRFHGAAAGVVDDMDDLVKLSRMMGQFMDLLTKAKIPPKPAAVPAE